MTKNKQQTERAGMVTALYAIACGQTAAASKETAERALISAGVLEAGASTTQTAVTAPAAE